MKIQEFSVGNKALIIEDTKIFWEGKLFDEEIIHPTEIRYGHSPIEVDMLTIGINSKIQLRNKEKAKFDISIKTYLGINKSKKTNLYNEICDTIWNVFFAQKNEALIQSWIKGNTVNINNLYFNDMSLVKKIKGRQIEFEYSEMELLPRYDHLLINSKFKPDKYFKINYLEEWNWPFIVTLLNYVVGDN